jgi:hypothetical protein
MGRSSAKLRLLLLFCTALLIARCTRRTNAGNPPGRVADLTPCYSKDHGRSRVTEDSLNGLALDAPLSVFVHNCPPFTLTTRLTEENSYPAITFHLGALEVVASQYRDSIDLTVPADLWELRGDSLILPGGLGLSARWRELRATYGRAIGDNEGPPGDVLIMFCAMPRFGFALNTGGSQLPFGLTGQLSSIPDTASIEEVLILITQAAGWRCQPTNLE